eukprot:SAG25_NODE_14181_length_258_cov_0.641509_1_plen_47_part_10
MECSLTAWRSLSELQIYLDLCQTNKKNDNGCTAARGVKNQAFEQSAK